MIICDVICSGHEKGSESSTLFNTPLRYRAWTSVPLFEVFRTVSDPFRFVINLFWSVNILFRSVSFHAKLLDKQLVFDVHKWLGKAVRNHLIS